MERNEALDAVAATRRRLDSLRMEQRGAATEFEGAVLTAARLGSTQREIAAHAGVSQPYIARTLAGARSRFVPRSTLGRLLVARRDQVIDIVHRRGADNVMVFGSVARGDDGPDSDIDLMVDIPDTMGLLALGQMERDVRDALGVNVDVVPSRLVKPEVAATSNQSMVAL